MISPIRYRCLRKIARRGRKSRYIELIRKDYNFRDEFYLVCLAEMRDSASSPSCQEFYCAIKNVWRSCQSEISTAASLLCCFSDGVSSLLPFPLSLRIFRCDVRVLIARLRREDQEDSYSPNRRVINGVAICTPAKNCFIEL